MNPFVVNSAHNLRRKVIITLLHRRRRQIRRCRQTYIRNLFLRRIGRNIQGEYSLLSDLEEDPAYFHKYFR